MNMRQSPVLAAVVAKQRQQELWREATRRHAAKIADSANKENNGWPWIQLRVVAASIDTFSARRLWAAAGRIEIRLPAR
jgi:hypothetical protein